MKTECKADPDGKEPGRGSFWQRSLRPGVQAEDRGTRGRARQIDSRGGQSEVIASQHQRVPGSQAEAEERDLDPRSRPSGWVSTLIGFINCN